MKPYVAGFSNLFSSSAVEINRIWYLDREFSISLTKRKVIILLLVANSWLDRLYITTSIPAGLQLHSGVRQRKGGIVIGMDIRARVLGWTPNPVNATSFGILIYPFIPGIIKEP